MKILLFVILGALLSCIVPFSEGIFCFSCDSSEDIACHEFWEADLDDELLYLNDCSHIQNAQYCVKMTGIYEGKLGTKRFCSGRDWGTECAYIQRPGDIQQYRSCISTCSGNACNDGKSFMKLNSMNLLLISISLTLSVGHC
uniref:Uncharacterized protein n=1 Tax=Lepeophtheirus salmonis TaxID=72036 RepID=A0A0K2V6G1_LEPSM